MKKIILFIFLNLIAFNSFCQNATEKVLYIVDSIPVIDEPKEGFGNISQDEIESVNVIKNKLAISNAGYKDFDGIIYVITKEYTKRPDSIKVIPSSRIMTKRSDQWFLKNSSEPYSGRFIDYYFNGKKEGEGTFLNGKLKGKRTQYYVSGNISDEIEYDNGISNGNEKRYYENGTLSQQGNFNNGKEVDVWEMYHQNGQLKQKTFFNQNGKMDGDSYSYYSTGELKGKTTYVNGIYQGDKINDKIFKLYNESQDLYKQGEFDQAIKKINKIIELDSNWVDGYFARGTMYLNNFQFEEATKDFDKTIEIEPFFINAYANRAFTIIRKYQFGNSRTLSKSKDVQVFASKEEKIPEESLKKVCEDLTKGIYLGDNKKIVLDAHKKYCSE